MNVLYIKIKKLLKNMWVSGVWYDKILNFAGNRRYGSYRNAYKAGAVLICI